MLNLLSLLTRRTQILSNVAEGIHAGGALTTLAASAIATKYVFGKLTSTPNQIDLAGSGNTSTGARAIGVITDEADAAGDPVAVRTLGGAGSTLKVLAGGSIAIGDLITSDTNSKAVSFTLQTAGTYHIYGIALRAATAGDLVEFAPVAGVEKVHA